MNCRIYIRSLPCWWAPFSFFNRLVVPLVLVLILAAPPLAAQKKAPPWVDYRYRNANYPEERYLTGFATEVNVEKKQMSAAFDKLNQLARNQIIEAIHVSVQAQSELDISVENTVTDERFRQISKSVARAQLAGLQSDTYYDKKKKVAYAFSYVLIQDLIDYYLDVVNSNLKVIITALAGARNSSDKQAALRQIYEARQKMAEVDQATFILTALQQSEQVNFSQITDLRKETEEVSNEILSTPTVNLSHLAAYFAYALLPRLAPESRQRICAGLLSYEDSGVESGFSRALLSSTINLMVAENEMLSLAGEDGNCHLQAEGHYSVSSDNLVVSLRVTDRQKGQTLASAEKSLPLRPLNTGGRQLLPTNFEWIPRLPDIALAGPGDELVIKTNEYLDKPLSVVLLYQNEPQADLPVKFTFIKDGKTSFTASVRTNSSGMAKYFLNKEAVPQSAEYELQIVPDVATLLGIDPGSAFYQQVVRNHPPRFRKIKLKVISPTVYVQASEYNLGQPLQVPLLEPAAKNALIENDFKFVDDKETADYTLIIEARTREGQQNQNIHFTYLDATLALYRNSTGREVYKNVLLDVKGASSSFELAGVKAYKKAIDKLLPDFIAKIAAKQ